MDLQLINIKEIVEEIQKRHSILIVLGKKCINEEENKYIILGLWGKDIMKSLALIFLLKKLYKHLILDEVEKPPPGSEEYN